MVKDFVRRSPVWVSAFFASIAVLGIVNVAWSFLIYVTALAALAVFASAGKPDGVVAFCRIAVLPVLSAVCMFARQNELAAILLSGWLALLGKRQENPRAAGVLFHFSGAALLFLLLEMVLLRSPLAITLLNSVSHSLSLTVRNAVGWGHVYGPHQYRFEYLIFCLLLAIPLFSSLWRKVLALLAFLPILAVSLYVIPIGAFLWAVYLLPAIGAFAIAGVCVAETRAVSRGHLTKVLYGCGAACGILIGLAILDPAGRAGNSGAKPILFLNDCRDTEGGEDDITNFRDLTLVKDFRDFRSTFQLAAYDCLVQKFLPGLGYRIEIKRPDEIPPESFQNYSLVVALCLQHVLPDNQRDGLYKAVESGSTNLLVYGDHTDIMGVQKPFNSLLAPVGVALNYDSAYPVGSSWANRAVFAPHPINRGVLDRPWFDTRISVGASLSTPTFARPIVVARDGYGDLGTPDAAEIAGLGDMQYNPGELYGGLVLACECRAGKGKVVAFGDTAMLQSGCVPFNAPYLSSLFDYMTRREPAVSATLLWTLGAFVTLVFMVLLLWRFSYGPALAAAILIAVSLSVSNLLPMSVAKDLDRDLVVIDDSHLEQFVYHGASDSLTTLVTLCSTMKPMPLVEDYRKVINSGHCRMIIFATPRKTFSKSEIRQLVDYVREGGNVIFTAGYFDSIYNRPLLQELGAEILAIPMGAGQDQKPAAGNASGMPMSREMWPVKATADWQPLILCFDQPTVAHRKIGKGTFCLVADSSGLLNYCLGDQEPQSGSYSFYSDLFKNYLLEKTPNSANSPEENRKA